MSIQNIEAYPWFLNKPLDFVVNEQMVRSRISATEWVDHWRPFLGRLYDLFEAKKPKRLLMAIGGPPGAGKSVFAEELHWIIDKGFFHKEAHSVALPMDGFHFPNTYLESHFRKMADGSEIKLSTVKGQPDTIDVKTLRRYIQALIARPESVPWPGYSRYTHDVIAEKFHVHASANLVIVEGNYLLLDRGPFAGLPAMFDLHVYVDAPAPKIIANLMDRHIRGGKSVDEAKEWVKRTDLPNARVAESTRVNADVIIERDTDEDIASVTWKAQDGTITKTEKTATTEAPATPSDPPATPAASAAPLSAHPK